MTATKRQLALVQFIGINQPAGCSRLDSTLPVWHCDILTLSAFWHSNSPNLSPCNNLMYGFRKAKHRLCKQASCNSLDSATEWRRSGWHCPMFGKPYKTPRWCQGRHLWGFWKSSQYVLCLTLKCADSQSVQTDTKEYSANQTPLLLKRQTLTPWQSDFMQISLSEIQII